jgi:hypothetical protein
MTAQDLKQELMEIMKAGRKLATMQAAFNLHMAEFCEANEVADGWGPDLLGDLTVKPQDKWKKYEGK